MTEELIKVTGAKKYFPVKNSFGQVKTVVKAVDDVSLTIRKGETLGLVGESGSGKTTLGRSILQLEELNEGEIFFAGQELRSLSKKDRRAFHKRMQIIFQDPYSSLNPQLTALEQVMEPLSLLFSKSEAQAKAIDMLEKVGLTGQDIYKYPREFSGGQRQRIGIARAVAVEPEFILCDEPISALDVSIQAQIINLLVDLQKQLKLTYLFISHDLSMVRYISDRIAVMYLGKLVEVGPTQRIFDNPQHPYTKKLLSAIPIADPKLARAAYDETTQEEQVKIEADSLTDWVEIEPDHFVAKERN
ncbi:ABC transporter ATP-binding protein [Vagococcus salmoninarum]|uniref:Peptide ABC transporter ATP-binding protein n=1 Tax=Vagococcus salmoninarum TaxID=2739 RepID=A0A429ZN97_9ENTE|nr:ATP-binding cassette domain-containing protein [Vagococcus salmoninarum]MBE9389396.1 ABC transporter ATP-binding protein [Vagococcus salmoninarum]RST95146.1 peptide ABC transporter ATP-binding protein [Vagococcus salmoninarum]